MRNPDPNSDPNSAPFSPLLPEGSAVSRRSFLQTLLCAAPAVAVPLFAGRGFAVPPQGTPVLHGHGQVKPPQAVPNVKLIRYDGAATTLPILAENHATAVQLMFTACTSICPIQAAIFEHVQSKLPDMAARRMQLLSLSIEPKYDTPEALSTWLRRFHAGPSWIAAATATADARLLRDFFGKGSNAADHSSQVSIVDRQGRLFWRTYELPAAEEIIEVLEKI